MATRYSDYERSQYGRRYSEEEDRGYEHRRRNYGGRGREDRGLVERTSDEVRSWFGDEGAERRRRMDELADERSSLQGRYRRGPWRLGDLRARDVMTRDVLIVRHSDPLARAARLMRECDCGAIPVVDNDGGLAGMVTDRDITVRLVARGVDIRRAFVDDCMTDEAFACNVNDSIEDCMETM